MSTDDMNTTNLSSDDDAAPLLDSNIYRTIKKMDRSTLEGLLNDLFKRGRNTGVFMLYKEYELNINLNYV